MIYASRQLFDKCSGSVPITVMENRHDPRSEAVFGIRHRFALIVNRIRIGKPIPKSGGHLPTPRSEEHTSELQSLMRISYAVFCLQKKNTTIPHQKISQ